MRLLVCDGAISSADVGMLLANILVCSKHGPSGSELLSSGERDGFDPHSVSMTLSLWLRHVGVSSVDVTSLDTDAFDGGTVTSLEVVAVVIKLTGENSVTSAEVVERAVSELVGGQSDVDREGMRERPFLLTQMGL